MWNGSSPGVRRNVPSGKNTSELPSVAVLGGRVIYQRAAADVELWVNGELAPWSVSWTIS